MAYLPYKKGTLLIPTGAGNHLFAIITDKCDQGCHLIVNFTSIRPNIAFDPTCVVEPGEHRFIKQQSYALYRMADIQRAERLARMVDGWVYRTHDEISDDLLNRIQDGVIVSQFTPRRIINYFTALSQ